ncbi:MULTISPECIES: amidohydrolase [Gordonia]|uniref:Amidohydrolase n=1 Tax=Gordonia amicalis TaxID=89053 RepID=A0ABU4DMP4_9ACTN|nr:MULTISPECIES: amidohydrolase [Gordonia]ATD70313.1 N-acyl-L-amino acid amidohydrolase [Gordonia sp. 1D]MBA5846367.1 amidohydrolase [Gordonia amicalis]MDV6310261.1 amidohydrolase [Gordonia amicalis]MDV7173399.1 amidohydrolase [Gordonia amicalis]UKO93879.1 amidohydrolase [Gordonia amicalis]
MTGVTADRLPDASRIIDAWLAAHGPELIAWRRDIHAHPELSRQEVRTTELVMAELSAAGLDPRRLPLGTGVVCDLGPSGEPRIGLRADMDALPVTEHTGLPFTSTVEGASHSCGHDAHTAILIGVAKLLASAGPLPVGVRLIFQAAEEVMPGGALDAIEAGVTSGLGRIFALHCDPRLPVGTVGLRSGPLTSAADHIDLQLHSAGGHTSRPHLTGDLIYAMGTVITGLPGVLSRRVDPRSGTVMVWGAANAGSAANAIPQEGRLRGTVRTGDHDTWAALEPLVRSVVGELLAPLGVRYDLSYFRGVPPVVNDEIAVGMLERAVAAIGPETVAATPQSPGGEDFSWYLEQVPGAMARLGVWDGFGPQVDLHAPNFDLDERALAIGVRTLAGVVLNARSAAGELPELTPPFAP